MAQRRLWPATNGGTLATDSISTDLGVKFSVTQPGCSFLGYFWWAPTGADLAVTHVTLRLWSTTNGTTGTAIAAATIVPPGAFTANTWNPVMLATPVALTANLVYEAVISYSVNGSDHYSATSAFWTADIVNGALTAPSSAHALNTSQDAFNEPSTGGFAATGTGTPGTNYWLDVLIDEGTSSAGTASRGFHPGRGPARARFWQTPRSTDLALITPALPESGSAAETLSVAAAVPLADAGAALADAYSDAYSDSYGVPGDVISVSQVTKGPVSSQFHPGRGPSARARFWQTPRSTDGPAASASAIGLPESGSAADTLSAAAAIPLAEAGTGTETLVAAAAVPLAETGSGAETLALTAAVPLAEAGTGAETLAGTAAVALAEAGSAADTAVVAAAVPLAESGIGTDSLSVSAPGAPALPESGSSAEALTATVTAPVSEAGSAADTLAVLVSAQLAESGAGAETALVTAAASLAEVAAAADMLAVQVLALSTSDGAVGRGFHPGRGPTRTRFFSTPRSTDTPLPPPLYGTARHAVMAVPAAQAGDASTTEARAVAGAMTIPRAEGGQFP